MQTNSIKIIRKICITYIALIALSLLFSNCSKKSYPTSVVFGEVSYVSYKEDILTLRVGGVGKNMGEAIDNAMAVAISNILFRGIPNSSLNHPMVGIDERTEMAKNKPYFDDLYKYKHYGSFIPSAVPETEAPKNGKPIYISTIIQINITALRMDLENNNIIHKFGL